MYNSVGASHGNAIRGAGVTGQQVGRPTGLGPERTTFSVFSPQYGGATYSVKYLGIVDGTMGILSRKMALQG
jgi:hypothetical protein